MLRGKEGWKEFGVTPEMVEEKMGSCWSYTKVDFSLFDLIANSASASMLLLRGIALLFVFFSYANANVYYVSEYHLLISGFHPKGKKKPNHNHF